MWWLVKACVTGVEVEGLGGAFGEEGGVCELG